MIEIAFEGDWATANKYFGVKKIPSKLKFPDRAKIAGVNKKVFGVESFFEEAERDVATKVLERVSKRLSTVGDEGKYRKSLELIRVTETGDFAIWSNPKKGYTRVGKIDTKNHVIYFRSKKNVSQSVLADKIVRSSPFVLGLLTEVPRTLDIFYRRVSTEEVDRVREKNSKVIKEILSDIKKSKVDVSGNMVNKQVLSDSSSTVRSNKEEFRLIALVKPDMEFFAIRLEKGYPGFVKKAHWYPVIKSMTMDEGVTKFTQAMFDEMKKAVGRPVLKDVSEDKLSDKLAEKVLQRFTEEVD